MGCISSRVASRVRVGVDARARGLARISVHNTGLVSLAARARSKGTYFSIRVRVRVVRLGLGLGYTFGPHLRSSDVL